MRIWIIFIRWFKAGYRICFVAEHLQYKRYACAFDASQLRHPANAYSSYVDSALVIVFRDSEILMIT
jgi:hypothetical protein